MAQTQSNGMIFGSAVSQAANVKKTADELIQGVIDSLGKTGAVDLAFLFASPHYGEEFELQHLLMDELKPKVLLGCTACGVVGNQHELEGVRAAALFAARLPDVRVLPFYITQSDVEEKTSKEDWMKFFGVHPEDRPNFFLMPDPFTFDATEFLTRVNEVFPGSPVMGGVASAAMEPGQNVLFLKKERFSQGSVGVALVGNVEIRTLVSQGCRPFGEPVIVTGADENVIEQLAGQPALDVLRDTFLAASKHDQALARRSLFVGCVVNEYKQKLERGDFVIRNVLSADQESGSIAIGDYVYVGQTVQFHVRDAESADQDLRELCKRMKENAGSSQPMGALMFNCNGRGRNMFEGKDHDITVLHRELGDCPTGGFFCAGELGPIGPKNFLHGFTSSIALFYPKISKGREGGIA